MSHKPEIEQRYFESSLTIETRQGTNNSRRVVGYALKFNSLSKDLGGFQEQIDPNALRGVDLSDVVALFNHDKNLVFARTSSKTLALQIDKVGLKYSFDAPATNAGNDLLVSIKRGDINGSSFAFVVAQDTWEKSGNNLIRTILKFERIIDVSPVVFPAYSETEVGKRNFGALSTNTKSPAFLEYNRTLVETYRHR